MQQSGSLADGCGPPIERAGQLSSTIEISEPDPSAEAAWGSKAFGWVYTRSLHMWH